jgi:lipopolysaccharide export system protein LptA
MRTLVLAAGFLLVGSLIVVLAVGKWKRYFNLHEVLKPLGANIQQEANGWVFSHALGAHSQYTIHASKLIQMTQGKGGHVLLHDVTIDLYGEDGSRVDRIEGKEFEYDQKTGTVIAAGLVEISLMKPGMAPAVAPKATPAQALGDKTKGVNDASKSTLAAAAGAAAAGEIHVKTSGLTFNQKTGIATTSQHVDFSMVQGSGSSMGATYKSQEGHLLLDQSVVLNTERNGEAVQIHAHHAEFERKSDLCHLQTATADYRGGEATAGTATVLFRDDGSAVHLDATEGFTLATANGSHVAAPIGSMDFNERNQPRHGHLEGGVTLDSTSQMGSRSRHVYGSSPTAELEFTPQGELRHTRMERGVEMHSEEITEAANSKEGRLRVSRTWRSPVAEVEFRDAGHGQTQPASMRGTGGVVITGESQRGNGAVEPSRMTADEVTGEFGPNSQLSAMTGVGHASLEETTATGTRQSSTGDRLEVHFATAQSADARGGIKSSQDGAAQIELAVLDGHVVLTQQAAPKTAGAQAETPMRATAGHAVYEGTGEWMHLTVGPRVEDGGLQLTAEKIDVSHASGDAFAHGNVKATWVDPGTGQGGSAASGQTGKTGNSTAGQGAIGLGGNGPAHVVSAEAQLSQATGEATFRDHARLWQQGNSVAAPVIVLDRQRQTLVARSTDPAEPVRTVLVSAGGLAGGAGREKATGGDSGSSPAKTSAPSVIRVRGGDLKYSGAERKGVMVGGKLGTVTAETASATSVSNEADLTLLPVGNHAGKDGGQGQVDRLVAKGHVTVTSEGRKGTGEQLVYTSETGEYVLTGTAAAPPRMNDPARGSVTGEALIFHSFDDSVSVESGGSKTMTETTAPK